jgi:pimeloyl-ACP methyl ester carboxylesterase
MDRCTGSLARFAAVAALGCLISPKAAEPISLSIAAEPPPATGLLLRWNGAGPDWAYTLQSRTSLADGIWLTRSERRPWPVEAATWIDSSPEWPANYYRVLAVPRAGRGRLIDFTLEGSLTPEEIDVLLQLADIPVAPMFAVDIYRLVYETIDPVGARARASGAVVLPRGVLTPVPLMSYQHGTLVLTNEAPSSLNVEILPGIGFAAIGYAVVLPDLLGFGESPPLHPYHHARSEATAAVDALRSARSWCADHGVLLNSQLFLVGYSQGGHATMALQRELELYHADEFTVTASAPMAGAYDLSGVTASELLSGRPMPNPYYLIYLLASYQQVYRLAPSLADLLASPYNLTLPPLMNGGTDADTLNAAMPTDARLVLKPEVLAALHAHPDHPLRAALRDNDLYRWTPTAPTRLFKCRGDQDVLFANSEVALASFHSRGAPHVDLIDPDPAADHGTCALPAFLLAKEWFDSFRP